MAWATGLTLGGVSGWRLPTKSPIDGNTFDTTFSNNATTDAGYAHTTTDGTDGGWRDGAGNPVSEMGHMYYVTLGNLGFCTPNDADPTGCTVQIGWDLNNTGPFSDIQTGKYYWSGTEFNSRVPWSFDFYYGNPERLLDVTALFAWAAHDGDVRKVVPLPTAAWLFGSGLLGMIGIARRKKAA